MGDVQNLWVQALVEASEDPDIAAHVAAHLREVHDFVSAGIARAQACGGIAAERDPDAEAWIFIAVGLLASVGRRLGGLLEDDFPKVIASRREWMTGSATARTQT